MTEDSVVALHHPGVTADPLTEVLRAGARELLAQAIEAEVAAVLAAHEHLKTEDGRRRLVRHGHGPERAILTGIGPVSVRRPKVRDRGSVGGERIRFTSAILPRFARRTRSLDAVLPTLYVNGGGNMYRRGGAKMMEWTPPPDGICMCQGGVVVRPLEGGGIRGTGYHRRDRFGEAQLSASWCWGGRLCRVPQEAEPGETAGLSRFSAALRGRDGGLRGRSPMGPRDRRARPRGEVAPAGLHQAVREAA